VAGLLIERWLAARPGLGRRVAHAAAGAALAVALVAGTDMADVRERYQRWMGAANVREVLAAIGDVQARSRGTALMGVWSQMSFPLIEWDLMLRGRDPASRPKNPYWYGDRTPSGLRDSLAADREVERLMVLELHPGAPAHLWMFDKENPGHDRFLAGFQQDPRSPLEGARVFPASGYTLHVFRSPARP
jgi:hypothetical protein